MTPAEQGILLLCCALGDPAAKPLTTTRFLDLGRRALSADPGEVDPEAQLRASDLEHLGLGPAEARHAAELLGREERLARYLEEGRRLGIYPVTRLSAAYPAAMRRALGGSCPPALFCAGNEALLQTPCVGLAGSRRIRPANARFARRAGELAAVEGLTLVTGGAEGADREALEACLDAGGSAIVFVPDDLRRRRSLAGERCLVCSRDGYDLPFSAARALGRNAYIHLMGRDTLIAQTDCGSGGTWKGALENLKHGWSRLYVYDDGSQGAKALVERGATALTELNSLTGLAPDQQQLF